MKKIAFLIVVLILFISCDKSKELQGTWVITDCSEFFTYEFKGDTLFKGVPGCTFDTLTYVVNGSKLSLYTKRDTGDISYEIVGDSLFWGKGGFYRFKKSNTKWYFQDLKNLEKLSIDIPEAKGKRMSLIHGCNESYNLNVNESKELVIFYGCWQINQSFNDLVNSIASNTIIEEGCFTTNVIFADKEVRYGEIRYLKYALRFANALKICYAVKDTMSKSYNSLYGIISRLSPVCEDEYNNLPDTITTHFPLPPLPQVYYKASDLWNINWPILSIHPDSTIYYNGEKVNSKQMGENLSKFVQNYKKEQALVYYIDDNCSYGYYITFLDILYKTFYKQRNQIAMKEYNQTFDDLTDSHKRVVQKRLPLAFVEIAKNEFDKLEQKRKQIKK